jgi:2,3-bisphosphoglycerate-dependent phosphoglycerate mutase
VSARRLFLVRHGRVDFSSRRFRESPRGRQWDPPLGEAGREQAEALAARLVLMQRPAAVYTSPFTRCRETIEPYAIRAGVEPVLDEEIGEVFIGDWEGLSFEEIISGDEELARRFREFEAMFSMAPGGESARELRARVVPAVERIAAAHPEGDLVLVTHGGVINAYLAHVLGIEEDMFFLPENTSINTVMVEGERRRVRFLNDTRHVTDPKVFVPPAGAEAAAD